MKSMDMKLKNIQTYKGYDGANILKLSFQDEEEMKLIRDLAREYGRKTNNDHKNKLDLFCVFESSDKVYSLL